MIPYDSLKALIFIANNILLNMRSLCVHVSVAEHRDHCYDRDFNE